MVSTAWAMASGSSQGSSAMNFVFPLIFIAIIWFLLIQPQRKQQKEHEKLIGSVKKGDKIITQGGIHAKVVTVKNTSVVATIDGTTKIEFEKAAIVRVVSEKIEG